VTEDVLDPVGPVLGRDLGVEGSRTLCYTHHLVEGSASGACKCIWGEFEILSHRFSFLLETCCCRYYRFRLMQDVIQGQQESTQRQCQGDVPAPPSQAEACRGDKHQHDGDQTYKNVHDVKGSLQQPVVFVHHPGYHIEVAWYAHDAADDEEGDSSTHEISHLFSRYMQLCHVFYSAGPEPVCAGQAHTGCSEEQGGLDTHPMPLRCAHEREYQADQSQEDAAGQGGQA